MTETASAETLRPPRLGPASHELSPRLRELLDALEQWIVEDGFASLTIEKMVQRLKCSRSTLYEIAPSRDELVLVVIDRRLRRIGAMKRERLGALASASEKIRTLIASQDLQIQATSIRFIEDAAKSPSVKRLIGDHLRYGIAQLRELIEEGMRSGEFNGTVDSAVAAHAIDAALQRIQDPYVLREAGRGFDDASLDVATLILTGLERA